MRKQLILGLLLIVSVAANAQQYGYSPYRPVVMPRQHGEAFVPDATGRMVRSSGSYQYGNQGYGYGNGYQNQSYPYYGGGYGRCHRSATVVIVRVPVTHYHCRYRHCQ